MAKFIINGETPLKGEITTAGNKNAALPIIVATLLTEEKCLLKNIPEIADVHIMFQLLQSLGKKVTQLQPHVYQFNKNSFRIRRSFTRFYFIVRRHFT